ncbi:hypothetical protein PTSG_12329 [Salpingoeca rosetta]|uniref:Uncharacterized protein n=1 Tax=Salpingoeca rosetta (strain ATCC 50818 / BSB-021) TaxID=946362 RepID=F2UBE7_SALR5|nr:uncharacterized protein PTSG_12329 [Salpingoeca rosetta]EGD73813.1 hypothetical protein PTSG_12329 [Salpingoeca rosetta]|eukprot:XP_004993376.1 hypothetical protein PTSG_12329 [Salpingoeca rosetta]
MFGRGFLDDDDTQATFGLGFTSRFGGLSGYDMEDDVVDANMSAYSAYGESDVIIEEPIFSKKRLGFKLPPSTSIQQVICAGGSAFVVLSNSTIVRRALSGAEADEEIHPIPRKREGQCTVERVFIDPTATHMITCTVCSDGHECFYIHLASPKLAPYTLHAVKRRKITAVAWNPLAQRGDPATQPILLGDAQGSVFEMTVNHNDHHAQQIFSVSDAPGGIIGIHLDVQRSSKLGSRFYIILACAHRFLQYMGPPGPEGQRFENILKRHELSSGGQEAPVLPRSQLSIYQRFPSTAEAMAWMTPLGAYSGHFDFANALRDESTAIPSFNVIPYNPATDRVGDEADVPESLVLTEFHLLLLYPHQIRAICTVNNKQVMDERMPTAAGRFQGIVRDPTSEDVLCYSEKTIYRIDTANETRDLWRLMMDKGNFDAALDYCTSDDERNEVHAAQAAYLFDNQEFGRAARAYSKTDVAFETIALKFLDKQEEGPLRTFLEEKLHRLSRGDITQRALLTTWLVELFLNALDKAETAENSATYERTMEEFKSFLEADASRRVLHRETVFDLISSHGNVDVLLFFAQLHSQHDVVVQHYIQMGQADKALDVLKQVGNEKPQLIYQFAAELIQAKPHELISLCSHMHLYEEAVEMALTVDLDMAVEQVRRAKDDIDFIDQAREKQLWLRIANHVIKVKNDIPMAMDLLKQSVLKIEDILPLFDDFKIIDPFQRNIQRSLESYNKEIQQLRESMEQSTTSARAIRADILQLNKRVERVHGDMMCDVCEYPLLTRAFYLFPCHHAFHKDCLMREVVKYLPPSQCRRVNTIRQDLRDLPPTAAGARRALALNAKLDEIAGQDCIVCGEIAIEMIEKPFIPKDQLEAYIESWSTGGVDLGPSADDEEFGIDREAPIMDSFT